MNLLPAEVKNIDYVVESGLCTRCGACRGVCPQEAVQFKKDAFPITASDCNDCMMCLQVCGGHEVNYPKFSQKIYGKNYDFIDNAIDPILYSKVAFSTDDEVRKQGSSGGLVSQILISLLKKKEIDGAVVTVFSKNNALRPEAVIARNREQVLQGAQSKYVLFPVSHIYKEIIETPGKYAIVGLPCQLHSLLKWQRISKKLRERIVLTVGLCCHANLENRAIHDLLSVKGFNSHDVKHLEFRGGSWPGGIRVTLKNGEVMPLHSGDIKDGAFNYLKCLYMAPRCLTCTDYSAEFSDIAVADPWIRNKNGDYLFQGGWSIAHVRTQRGSDVLAKMEADGDLVVEDVSHNVVIDHVKALTQHKKRGAFIRIAQLRKKGKPYPEYYLVPPKIRLTDYYKEFMFQLSLTGWYIKPARRLLLKLAFSGFGERIKRLRAVVKKTKYRLFSNAFNNRINL